MNRDSLSRRDTILALKSVALALALAVFFGYASVHALIL
jgi:hypothetical protein